MSLLLGLGTLAGGAVTTLNKREQVKKENEQITRQAHLPDTGVFLPPSQIRDLARTGVVYRIIPDPDLRGVPFWHLDFGSGGFVRTYADPNLIGISHHRATSK
jgi:hypothetical protein